MDDPLKPTGGPELFIALVGAVGTDLPAVVNALRYELGRVNYEGIHVKLSASLRELGLFKRLEAPHKSEYQRIRQHMRAGSKLRAQTGRGDILALLAIAQLRELRSSSDTAGVSPRKRTAYILDSIKHPDEIYSLRDIYGEALRVVSVYSNREVRLRNLSTTIAQSRTESDARRFESKALKLMRIDEHEAHTLGQRMSDAFPLADYFIQGDARPSIDEGARRFVELFFDKPFVTPTPDEFGMFQAYSAALRSSDLSRQVGAAIVRTRGEVLAVGCNEVPRAFGGQYWEGDAGDTRDFQLGVDSNAVYRRQALLEIISRLKESEFLESRLLKKKPEELLDALNLKNILRPLRLDSIIEFSRAVHAEMAAITEAAKKGVSTERAILYTTTFPCHLCAKHIISSGIASVVYIEPYPKNQVEELYSDSVSVDPLEPSLQKVTFRSFVGVAPRSYRYFFHSPTSRKDQYGNAIRWDPGNAEPRLKSFVPAYLIAEANVVKDLPSILREK